MSERKETEQQYKRARVRKFFLNQGKKEVVGVMRGKRRCQSQNEEPTLAELCKQRESEVTVRGLSDFCAFKTALSLGVGWTVGGPVGREEIIIQPFQNFQVVGFFPVKCWCSGHSRTYIFVQITQYFFRTDS